MELKRKKRRVRWTPDEPAGHFRFMERDKEIVRFVGRYFLARSNHIYRYLNANDPSIQRSIRYRLRQLFVNHYLVKPTGQFWRWKAIEKGKKYNQISKNYGLEQGSIHSIYGLGREGAKFLQSENGFLWDPAFFESNYLKDWSWSDIVPYILVADVCTLIDQVKKEGFAIRMDEVQYPNTNRDKFTSGPRIMPMKLSVSKNEKTNRYRIFFDLGSIPIVRYTKGESFTAKVLRSRDYLSRKNSHLLFILEGRAVENRMKKMIAVVSSQLPKEMARRVFFLKSAELVSAENLYTLKLFDGTGEVAKLAS